MPNRLEESQQAHNDACRHIAERFAKLAIHMSPEDRTDVIDELITIGDEELYGDLLDKIERG